MRDSSGMVSPGVTVEASGPALIEKVRSVVTDRSGTYHIVDLRPGTYVLTFRLPGFTIVRREGIELTGSFNATVNVELRVGLTETLVVAGEPSVVDTRSIHRQLTLGNEVLTSVPTARSWAAIAVLMPGIVTLPGASLDVPVSPQMTTFGGPGGRMNEGRVQVDGFNTGSALNGGGQSTYVADISNAEEVVTTVSGGLGEAEVGGPTLNVIPKSGGNRLAGEVYLSGVPKGWVDSNYTAELEAQGLSTPGALIKQWDFTGGIGGPIIRDRIWYFATARSVGQHRTIPGIFPNLNAGDPSKWEYVPDKSRQARGAESFETFSARFTVQATPRNKVNVHWDWQIPCNGAAATSDADACRTQPESGAVVGGLGVGGLTATTSPEVAGYLSTLVQNRQITWSSPVTSRLLLDAGLGSYASKWGPFEAPGNATRGLVRVVEQAARNGAPAGLTYRSANWAENYDSPTTWRAAVSYVTGTHSVKAGYIGAFLVSDLENHGNDLNLSYTFNNGRPISLMQSLRVFTQKDRAGYAVFYGQDQWSVRRFTIQGALRFDRAWSYSPAQSIGPTNFLSTRLDFPKTSGVDAYRDLSLRGGVAWDLFGTGKTSLKFSVGKYLEPVSNLNGNYSISNPIQRIAAVTQRAWVDDGAGGGIAGDFVPQCDLLSRFANGECGAMGSQTFGTDTQVTAAIDPRILGGWNVRPGDWQIGTSIQREIVPRVSVEAGYLRRWLTNFATTDNEALSVADFTEYSFTAPLDPRLPGGGGYVVGDLYNITASGFLRTPSNKITFADDYGGQTQVYNGLLVNVSARLSNGLTAAGGISSGKTVTDYCRLRASIPELSLQGGGTLGPTNPYCRVDPGIVTKMTGVATYTIPVIDVLVAGTVRSEQGAPLRAIYNVPRDQISAILGRPAQGSSTMIPIDLVAPGAVWGNRVNEIDLRFAKVLRVGSSRTHVGVDIFNILNSNAVLTYNQTFVPNGAWLAPQSVLTPRFVKLSAQIDF